MAISTGKSLESDFPLLSASQVEGLIADGQSIIIIDQKVLRLDAWLPYHPGGYKPIQHFIGKDATDEFRVYDPLLFADQTLQSALTGLGCIQPKLISRLVVTRLEGLKVAGGTWYLLFNESSSLSLAD
jgi:hypothetical protein